MPRRACGLSLARLPRLILNLFYWLSHLSRSVCLKSLRSDSLVRYFMFGKPIFLPIFGPSFLE